MEVRGWLVTANNPTNLPVAIVEAGIKRIGAAVIVGDYATDTVCAHGQACIDLLCKAANANGMFGTLMKVELATEAGTARRIEMILACASDGDVAVFMCADDVIFDAAWRALNVRK